MSPKFTRSSLKFEYFKRLNTDNTPFEAVLYFMKGSDQMIVEDPDNGKAYYTNRYHIRDYIKVENLKTPWTKNIDGSYLRFDTNHIHHILPIHKNTEFVNLTIHIELGKRNIKMVRSINEKHFKIEKTEKVIKISASLPIWEIWAKVSKHRFSHSDNQKYQVNNLYMRIKDQFYRFPYGNVNQSNHLCLGTGNTNTFDNIEQIWFNFITTPFNTDYGFNFKSITKQDDPVRLRYVGRSSDLYTINIPTFDLEHINMLVQLKRFDKICIMDGLYYLSNVEDVDDETIINMLYLIPTLPWKEKENS